MAMTFGSGQRLKKYAGAQVLLFVAAVAVVAVGVAAQQAEEVRHFLALEFYLLRSCAFVGHHVCVVVCA